MIKFVDYINEEKKVNENINKGNWEGLKKFMASQPGFVSWGFEYDNEELVVKFKTNKQAMNAMKKSHDSTLDIGAFGGDVSAKNSEIRVELYDHAINSLDDSIIKECNREINEAINAMKVFEYYMSTMNNIENFGSTYSSPRVEDKMNRRILTDYAGDEKKLKEIYKQIQLIANTLDDGMGKLKSIIG